MNNKQHILTFISYVSKLSVAGMALIKNPVAASVFERFMQPVVRAAQQLARPIVQPRLRRLSSSSVRWCPPLHDGAPHSAHDLDLLPMTTTMRRFSLGTSAEPSTPRMPSSSTSSRPTPLPHGLELQAAKTGDASQIHAHHRSLTSQYLLLP
jgi:hypothetical protein